MTTTLEVGKKYNLTIHGTLEGAKDFSGLITGITTGAFLPAVADAGINHANIYPTLPEDVKLTTANDYTTYNFVSLRTDSGTEFYIGLPWILAGSVELVQDVVMDIRLSNFKEADKDMVLKVLQQAGQTVSSMTVVK